VDALDTLLIMGMKEEFDKGREWVASNLDMSTMVSFVCKVTRGVNKRCRLMSTAVHMEPK
jgi:hypothetical protein